MLSASPTKRSTAQTFASFPDFLASTLRVGCKLRVYHISTPAVAVPPIFTAAPGCFDERTTCETHFLTIARQHRPCHDGTQEFEPEPSRIADESENDHILVLGIEVLVFTTASLITIFVSKADSTGFLSKSVAQGRGASSISRTVIVSFLEWLVAKNLSTKISENASASRQGSAPPQTIHESTIEYRLPNSAVAEVLTRPGRKKLVLSLFARSQNQYLFPGSIENETKHVLDDRQLIRWWCGLLDQLVQKDWLFAPTFGNGRDDSHPGSARSQTISGLVDAQQERHLTSYIAPEGFLIVPGCDRAEVTRTILPASARPFKDDGRVKWHNEYPVQFLVGSKVDSSGSDLPVRCAIPRFPDDPKARYCDDLDGAGLDDTGRWRDIKTLRQFWETMEYRQECAAGRLVGFIWITFDPTESRGVKREDDSSAVRAIPAQTLTGYVESTDVRFPPGDRVSESMVLLTAEQYVELSDLLINDSDFAGTTQAIKSTNDWVGKLRELSGIAEVGTDIEGQWSADTANMSLSNGTNGHKPEDMTVQPRVNVLTVKKRKRNGDDASEQSSSSGPTVLAASLVRKKSKVQL